MARRDSGGELNAARLRAYPRVTDTLLFFIPAPGNRISDKAIFLNTTPCAPYHVTV